MVLMAARNIPVMKNIVFLIAVSSAILVSGCVNDNHGISYGNGVLITAFESDLGATAVQSEDDVGLMLKVQNQGEVDATNVEAQIMGIDLDEWGTGFSWSGDKKQLGTLLAADPVTKTQGQIKTAQWTLTAPNLPSGTELTYEPRVRTFYDYRTRATKSVTLVDVEELRRIIQQGRSLPGGSTRSSAGPLSVEVRTGDFVKTQNYDDPFPLNIFITNMIWESGGSVIEGSGYYGGWVSEDLRYPVKVTITLPEGMSLTGETTEG
jgi:hypothetical protein